MLDTIRNIILPELERYETVFRSALRTDNPLLSSALNHLTHRLGKMLRPMLVLLCAREGGATPDAVLHAAAGLELLHTASLVHDDVVDESPLRRGQPSVNALFDNKAAVLVGDFITSAALTEITLTASLHAVERTAWLGKQLADGELLQLANTQLTTFDEQPYYDVIAKKTAALFATCARLGALLGGAEADIVGRLEQFGHYVGLCFQMRDDLFDLNPRLDVGKPQGNDMREGKLTLPVLYALRDADNQYRDLALKVRGGTASDADIQQLADYAVTHGGIPYVEAEMERMADTARALLPALHNREVADALALYLDFVINRNQ